ncbi:MAG: hypothetical protein WCJ33_04340, partial [Pseudomonadota bacterium]
MLDISLRTYNNPEQRLKFLEVFTAKSNDYGIKNTCSLLVSEHPEFLREKLPDLIKLIRHEFKEAPALT